MPGANLPPLDHPDLLVLESTYGAIGLHPNRLAEETRLAETVAHVIAGSGHVLIPAFALGRAQEVLLILTAAQQAEQIPRFPLFVDGLVRRVTLAYQTMPEALSPRLQRAIQRGHSPLSNRAITFVRDAREREQILAGPPSCIIASSGMLTGGPSAWYAARLAGQERAAILLTGYQDEEAPGRQLQALAGTTGGTLTVSGQTVPVRCTVATYGLSAHADAGELAGYVAALRPAAVALVHGGSEARAALAARLERVTIHQPVEGETLTVRAARRHLPVAAGSLVELPLLGIGRGRLPTVADLSELLAVARAADLESTSVTLRELAQVWEGRPTEAGGRQLAVLLTAPPDDLIPDRDLAGIYAWRDRIRVPQQGRAPEDLAGQVLLLRVREGQLVPALCRSVTATGLLVTLARGNGRRTRFLPADVLEVLGPWPADRSHEDASEPLKELDTLAAAWRRRHPPVEVLDLLEPDATYSLAELGQLVGILPEDRIERLGLAHQVNDAPELFVRRDPAWGWGGPARYAPHPDAARHRSVPPMPRFYADTAAIRRVVEQHLPPETGLYRISLDPATGDATLGFLFPDVARIRYADQFAAIAAETGVTVAVSLQPHQGELTRLAGSSLPAGLLVERMPAILFAQKTVRVVCRGTTDPEAVAAARVRFYEETGWDLDLVLSEGHASTASASRRAVGGRMEQNAALDLVCRRLGPETGLYKAGAETVTSTLVLRFQFPDVARERYANELQALAAETGWRISVHPLVHQGALEEAIRQALPPGARIVGAPSVHAERKVVEVTLRHSLPDEQIEHACTVVRERTIWSLEVRVMP